MAKPNKNLSEWIDTLDSSEAMPITLGKLIERTAKQLPDNEALVYSNQPDVDDIRWTYKVLDEMSTNLAKAFVDVGFSPGETIGVWGPNHPEWILTEYALAKAGLRIVTLNPLYKEQELIFALKTVSAVAVVHAELIGGVNSLDVINAIKNEIPSLKYNYKVKI